MKIPFLLAIACLWATNAFCQRSFDNVKWNAKGNGFYEYSEEAGIELFALPDLSKKTVLGKAKLVTAEGKALDLQDFSIIGDGNQALLFCNARKVWRYATRGDYWLADLKKNTVSQLGKTLLPSSLMFAKISPDGTKAAYVSQHNLYVEDLANGKIKQLTKDGNAKLINGTFDWAYEEEFGCRDGFRWDKEGNRIAYWQIDATKIRNFLMLNTTDSIYSFTVPVEYPKVGEDPSACRVGVVDIKKGKTQWMDVPGDAVQHYIPRMEWTPDGKVILQQLNRKQNESKVFVADAASGKTKLLFQEENQSWIEVKGVWKKDDPTGWDFLSDGKSFIWVSEKDGWRHVYKIGTEDAEETLLTKGNYDIVTIDGLDEANGKLYFTASPYNATQRALYSVGLAGNGDTLRVSPLSQQGTHHYSISPNGTFASHQFSDHATPASFEWISLASNQAIGEREMKKNTKAKRQVEMIKITTDEGVTMDGWMAKPIPFDSSKKYPVVFYVYSEPGSATVTDHYGAGRNFLYAGNMAEEGYIHISLDGRGTPSPKGAAWRKAIYRKVGILNVRDQAMAAKKILQWPFVDTARIAVWGWSGGGSTTLNLMFQYPDIYKTGIAIAPVAYRLSYDNIYEERYMGVPSETRADYIRASAITHASGLKGNLLLVHGTGDDNVHYQNTELLINELVKHGKQFSLMSYPNRSHSISEGSGTYQHLSQLYTRFLKEHCPGGGK